MNALNEPVLPQKKKWKKWLFRGIFLIFLFLIIWFVFGKNEKNITYVTEEAKISAVKEIVEVSGTTESPLVTNLRFGTSGTVTFLPVHIGDTVKKGDLLAKLDDTSEQAEVLRMQASLASAQAELKKRYAGPTQEDEHIAQTSIEQAELYLRHAMQEEKEIKMKGEKRVSLAEQEVENAKIALENAIHSGENTSEKSSTALQNVLENTEKVISASLDNIKSALSTADSILGMNNEKKNAEQTYIGFYLPEEKNAAKNLYRQNAASLLALETEYTSLSLDSAENAKTFLKKAETQIVQNRTLLSSLYTLLENSSIGLQLTETEVTVYQTTVETRLSTLAAHLQSVRTLQQSISDTLLSLSGNNISTETQIDSAKNTLLIAEKNLSSVLLDVKNTNAMKKRATEIKVLQLQQAKEQYVKLVATPRPVDVAMYKAAVDQNYALLMQAQARLNDTRIVSSADGIITNIIPKEGETITNAENAITLMTEGLQVTAYVPETDISKVLLDAPVEMTFDALDFSKIFSGNVSSIEPAETIIDGVVYYKITVSLSEKNIDMIRSGMTADMNILFGENDNALTIPAVSVQYENNKPFIFVLKNGKKQQVFVQLGLEGEDRVEMKEGISKGDRIVLAEEEN